MQAIEIKNNPRYCEYANGPCDQDFNNHDEYHGLFLYPSQPEQIAAVIETAAEALENEDKKNKWITWADLNVTGQIIFCEICKAMRFSKFIIADVTTLNRNLLFEIGYALGLGLPVIPIRDTSYIRDTHQFEELGLLSTIGYTDFQNAGQLTESLKNRIPISPIPKLKVDLDKNEPIYLIKGPIETEAEVKLFSELKKSAVYFRTYDTVETPNLSLYQVRKQVAKSICIIASLISPNRRGAIVHNARCSFISGIAMALEKTVLMLQEDVVRQPIDYRDVVVSYTTPRQVPSIINKTIINVIHLLQSTNVDIIKPPKGLLQNLDIGDVAAENEIRLLNSYFVQTGQYLQAKRGHARIVVGRKGSGKTAIFYAVRNSFGKSHSRIVLDLKPEGHQFTKLREVILSKLSPGLQEHTLTALWNFILLAEIANKIVEDEYSWAFRDTGRLEKFDRVKELYRECGYAESGDFSQRLLYQVDNLITLLGKIKGEITSKDITNILFSNSIKELNQTLSFYLEEKQEVWLLVDNLDKSWPTRGTKPEDILILRTLLEATRKIQRQLERHQVNFHCLVFLRNDIYEHLLIETPDKGKDTPIILDWSDEELFKDIFRKRIETSGILKGSFDQIWNTIFEGNIGTRHSFNYIIERTLMRPRDFLMFIHLAIEVAINRGHDRVLAEDLLQAETRYSNDLLNNTAFELKDVYANLPEFIYSFLECKSHLSEEEAIDLLRQSGFDAGFIEEIIRLLIWFGFLGVKAPQKGEPQYSYQVRYDLAKLMAPLKTNSAQLVIHPAFRSALECKDD